MSYKIKFILDACCGSRMFWFNKKHPNALFIDNREYNKGFIDNRPNRELHPDIIMDFRDLKFPDKSFKLVVMDPPHLIGKPNGCRMTKTYGNLNKLSWKEDIKKGFDECMRVLEDYGILIFKWNEASIKRKEILEVLKTEPLFGHPNGSKIPTNWFCFMKIPQKELSYPENDNQSQQKYSPTRVGVKIVDSADTRKGLCKNCGCKKKAHSVYSCWGKEGDCSCEKFEPSESEGEKE